RAVFAFPETLAAAIPSARPSAPSRLSSGPRDGAVLSSQPLGARGIGPACGVQLAGPGRVAAVTCTCRNQPGVRYPSLCRPDGAAQGRLPERPKGAVCKTVGYAFPGSNPGPATSQSWILCAMRPNAMERWLRFREMWN